ncbi:type III secretion protein L [Roseateles sp. YR242]|uniref:type III secretion system stator protein SctL n=1 Tax=Roseateles sp. YR242 TaxID=1855305 RepID=UPI0008C22E7F|nr:type III secretion system stator protein SctL [Roseateles sp. YR242]SEK24863.1 type III secretion protein L [Roseateles sp. YR242]
MLIWWRADATDGGAGRAGADGPGEAGAPDGVLRAEQVAALREVAEIRREASAQAEFLILQAQAQADQLLADAQAQAEALMQDAQAHIDAACQAGRADGERQAALAWHERQAGQLLDQAEAVRGLHEKLADVVTSAVERIVQNGDRAALYQRALRSVQTLSRSATALTLKVSHQDFEAARDGIAAVPELQGAGLNVEVVVDPALPIGSCLFESNFGVVDASLDTQLNALRQAMARAVRRAIAEG